MPAAASPIRATPSTASIHGQFIYPSTFDHHIRRAQGQAENKLSSRSGSLAAPPTRSARPVDLDESGSGALSLPHLAVSDARPSGTAHQSARVPLIAGAFLNERMLYHFPGETEAVPASSTISRPGRTGSCARSCIFFSSYRDPAGHHGAAGGLRYWKWNCAATGTTDPLCR